MDSHIYYISTELRSNDQIHHSRGTIVFPTPGLRCRQIDEGDIGDLTTLLTRGLPKRGHAFFF